MTASSMASQSANFSGHATQKRGHLTQKRKTSDAETLCRFLRAQYPARTAEAVAADTGFAVSTIAKMLMRQTKPNFDLTLAMVGAYGPEFLAAVYPGKLQWLDQAVAERERQALRSQLDALQARLAAL